MRQLDWPTRRLLIGHALAAVGMSLPWPLLLALVWRETHDDTLLGIAGALRMLPYVVCSWAAGRLADRYRRDLILRASLLGRIGCLLITAVSMATGHTWVALAAAALAIAVGTPAYPAAAAAVPGLSGRRSERATELLVTVEVASFVVGPALGGLMLGPGLRDLVGAASAVLVVAAYAVVRPLRLPRARPVPRDSTGSDWSGWSDCRRPGVFASLMVISLVNFLLALVGVALLPLAEGWGSAEAGFGVATAAVGFGALAAPLLRLTGLSRRSLEGRVRWGMVAIAAGLAVLGPSPALVWGVAPLILVGALACYVEGAATGVLQRGVPDEHRASVLGIGDTAMVAAAMVGALIGPSLVEGLGAVPALLSLAALAWWGSRFLRTVPPEALPSPASAVAHQG